MPTRTNPFVTGSLIGICTLLPALAGAQVIAPAGSGPALPPPTLDPVSLAPHFDVSALSLQLLHPVHTADPTTAEVLVEIEVDGATWTLSLLPHSLRGTIASEAEEAVCLSR